MPESAEATPEQEQPAQEEPKEEVSTKSTEFEPKELKSSEVKLTKEKPVNSFLGVILIFAIFLLTGAGAAVLYLTTKDTKKNTIPANYIPEDKTTAPTSISTTSSSVSTTSKETTVAWNTYQNSEYGFEFKYPTDWDFVSASGIPYSGDTGIGEGFFVILEKNNWEFVLTYGPYSDVMGA
ncbi:MAG: hypothetical protein PHS44_08375, partial [Candidatus Dojkabacteria bacterium]|nr:hypothetical protein [Candidatus Dojkabacteria bacterium]